MRIVLVYQHFAMGGAGSSKAYDLARYLAGAGHDVTVICGRSKVAETLGLPPKLICRRQVEGFELISLGVRYGQGMSFANRLGSFLAFTTLAMGVASVIPRYDVMLASSTPLSIGLVGLVSGYVRSTPWVFEIRDLWPECPYQNGFIRSRNLVRLATVFEEWFYRDAEFTSAISQMMVDRLIERGFPREKLRFTPTGVDLGAFSDGPDDDFRERLGLGDHWVAVYVGAHGRANGLDYVIEGAEALRHEDDIRIVLVGSGTEKDRLQEMARQRGLLGRPLVFHDPVAKGEVPGILQSADAVLMINADRPGMKILMPNKFFDYLASSRPLIVNLDAEITDWITSARCGLRSDPADPADLARVIEVLRSEPAQAEKMGLRARELARVEFDRERLHQRWEALLGEAARHGRRRFGRRTGNS